MANRRITDLTALTAPATGDFLPIVDVSEALPADQNKKITYSELLASAPSGTAAAPSFSFDTTSSTGIYSPGTNQLALTTAGVGRLFVDASGNINIDSNTLYVDAGNNRVGIGTASPAGKLQINVQDGFLFDVGAGAYSYMRFGSQGAGEGVAELGNDRSAGSVSIKTGATGSALSTRFQVDAAGASIFYNQNGLERARIDSSGRLLLGTASNFDASYKQSIFIDSTGGTVYRNTTSGTHYPLAFQTNTGTYVGSISTTSTATTYTTFSDYRLKENVTAVTDGITRLRQLKPSRFNFIAEPGKIVDGFLAHEAAEVVHECVTGEKDAMDVGGNPVYQGIDQSKLVPLLTAALQEAIGEIESLKARVAALESA